MASLGDIDGELVAHGDDAWCGGPCSNTSPAPQRRWKHLTTDWRQSSVKTTWHAATSRPPPTAVTATTRPCAPRSSHCDRRRTPRRSTAIACDTAASGQEGTPPETKGFDPSPAGRVDETGASDTTLCNALLLEEHTHPYDAWTGDSPCDACTICCRWRVTAVCANAIHQL